MDPTVTGDTFGYVSEPDRKVNNDPGESCFLFLVVGYLALAWERSEAGDGIPYEACASSLWIRASMRSGGQTTISVVDVVQDLSLLLKMARPRSIWAGLSVELPRFSGRFRAWVSSPPLMVLPVVSG